MNATALLEADPAPAEVLADENTYEVVHNARVKIPPVSTTALRLANRLSTRLNVHAEPGNLVEAVVETLFRMPLAEDPNRNRRPDVAFVSAQRWPMDRPTPYRGNAWEVVPDLAAEVLSPTDLAEEILGKVGEYFRAGVWLVWVISPALRQVYVWESPKAVRILTASDTLDVGAVLPDFRLHLERLFSVIDPEAREPRPDDA